MISIEHRWAEFWTRYEAGTWEPETRALLAQTLKPGDLFVDIGAWIGPVTLWALALGARVISIEPDPVAAAELRCRVPEGVEVWEGAVAQESGHVCIAPRHQFGDSMTRIADEGLTVGCWTLPEILKQSRLGYQTPALVKMDIEGYELELLPSVAPYLADLGVPLVVSLHTDLPDPAWFAGYGHVDMPTSARDKRGRSTNVIARP